MADSDTTNNNDTPEARIESGPKVPETLGMAFSIESQDYSHKSEVERMKEEQTRILTEWAEGIGMAEGQDFSFGDIRAEEKPENISPHEATNVYFMFKDSHFAQVRDFFENDYYGKMGEFQHEWTPKETKLNYSWAGRFCVEDAGGTAIDTAPVQSLEPIKCETHHGRFKEIFREDAGFELPTPEKLQEIMETMSDNLGYYEQVYRELNKRIYAEEQKKRAGGESKAWKYNKFALNIAYVIRILTDAKRDKGLKAIGAEPQKSIKELPEVIETRLMDEKVRHYNDLTYNAADFVDLDEVNGVLDGQFAPPTEKGARSDHFYEDYYGFDRKRIEGICKKLSEELYPRKNKDEQV